MIQTSSMSECFFMHVAVDNTVIALFTKKLKWCVRNWEFVPLHLY